MTLEKLKELSNKLEIKEKELYESQISCEAANQELRATNEELRSRERQLQDTIQTLENVVKMGAYLFTCVSNGGKIYKALCILGTAVNADRIYIFKFLNDGSEIRIQQMDEWTKDKKTDAHNPLLSPDYSGNVNQRWYDAFERGDIIHGTISTLPDNERIYFESKGVKAVLAIPIYVKKQLYGFVGFDACDDNRLWTGVDLRIIQNASQMIGLTIEAKCRGKND